MKKSLLFYLFISILWLSQGIAQGDLGYQTPPEPMAALVNAPSSPGVSINAQGDVMLLLGRSGYPSVEELAQPELRIAGYRINPRTNGSSRGTSYESLTFKNLTSLKETSVTGLPNDAKIESVSWSPKGQKVAFMVSESTGLSLWYVEASNGQAKRLTQPILNDALGGSAFNWLSDGQSIIYKSVLSTRGETPTKSLMPSGPVVQESLGKKSAVRTYQDLLENQHDEALFDYYGTAQIMKTDLNGQSQKIGMPAMHLGISPSPDGNYILTNYIKKPYSYLVPASRFPMTYEIWDKEGKMVKMLADIPVSDNIPKGFDATRTGPRSIDWRADVPAMLYWVEAQDGGDPAKEVAVRDQLFMLNAPFNGEQVASLTFKLRYGGIEWGNNQLALATEYWRATRQTITYKFTPNNPNSKKVMFDRSSEDRYSDPGGFVTEMNQYGQSVLKMGNNGKILYLTGQGASAEGDRPFVDEFDIATYKTNRWWRSEAPYYEMPIRVVDFKKKQMITRRESKDEPSNYFIRTIGDKKLVSLTSFENPYKALEGIEKQVINFKRNDGIDLSGDLYLPKGYQKSDEPLPVLMWAYPREYKSKDAAGQVSGSPYEFIRLSWATPIYWVTRGYAVFDAVSMPIVGEGDKEPNDTFVKQLVANAEAAIDVLVDMGVGDRNRMAVGGHSYGAFMTANLLAHSDLFAAGIARSGAYNRTLTPFGFQAEERTYWDDPSIYNTMSPFMNANKINEPLLLIHGIADNNSGTFPIQSERFYAALKGLGATTRLVMLPHESHGYQGKESIMHMLWEMDTWLETYVKNKKMSDNKNENKANDKE